jgi:beta-N-acetylhexosaminidase
MDEPMTKISLSPAVQKILTDMTIEEKLAHVLCPKIIPNKHSIEDVKKLFDAYQVGSVFMGVGHADKIKELAEAVQKYAKYPVVINMDILWGPGHVLKEKCTYFTTLMGCGAADDEELTYQLGESISVQGRAHGIHWTLGPVGDLNLNFNSPIVNFRAFGDSTEHVLKHIKQFIHGVQDDFRMAAALKHFPGDGVDDRDQHFVTSVNAMSKEEWMNTFGKIYKEAIADGVLSIMPGHIALPWCDPGDGAFMGAPPATLSKKILVNLLRKELGFEGVIVTDAIRMTGLTSHAAYEDIAHMLIESGNDVVLFSDPDIDFAGLQKAFKEGSVTKERLDEAVSRILIMKEKLGMFSDERDYSVEHDTVLKHEAAASSMADKSISIVRDIDNRIPVSLNKGEEVLCVTVEYERNDGKFIFIEQIVELLNKRGYKVEHIKNPRKGELASVASAYKAVFVNINVGAHARAGIIRLKKEQLGVFEDIAQLRNSNIIITSFGDPYKIYEIPYVRTMVNAYSPTPKAMESAVKVWFGELPAQGKCPVSLSGFLNREV